MKRVSVVGLGLAMITAACGGQATTTLDTQAATTSTTVATTTSTTSAAPTTTSPPQPPTTTTTVAPTTTTTVPLIADPPTFDWTHADDPTVLTTGERWDATYSYSPSVVATADTFHLFYTGWNIAVAIGHATSTDGAGFVRPSDGPVVEFRETVGGRTWFPQRPVVHETADGWVMYFGVNVGKRFNANVIGRATAAAPEGPWTVDEGWVYEGAADWEANLVPHSVVAMEGGVILFYDTQTDSLARVGRLASSDGVDFTPYDDPATEGADWVLGPSETQAWDGAGAGSPVVLDLGDRLGMFYVGLEGPEAESLRSLRIGWAESTDGGVTWAKHPDNPVLVMDDQTAVPASLGYPWLDAVIVGDEVYLYYALSAGANGIGLVRSPAP